MLWIYERTPFIHCQILLGSRNTNSFLVHCLEFLHTQYIKYDIWNTLPYDICSLSYSSLNIISWIFSTYFGVLSILGHSDCWMLLRYTTKVIRSLIISIEYQIFPLKIKRLFVADVYWRMKLAIYQHKSISNDYSILIDPPFICFADCERT